GERPGRRRRHGLPADTGGRRAGHRPVRSAGRRRHRPDHLPDDAETGQGGPGTIVLRRQAAGWRPGRRVRQPGAGLRLLGGEAVHLGAEGAGVLGCTVVRYAVTWRMPSIDLPYGAEVEEMLCVAIGGVDSYDFHALEVIQCMAERRKGGET